MRASAGSAAVAVRGRRAGRPLAFHGYSKAVELKLGTTRAVVSPQAGGRLDLKALAEQVAKDTTATK